MKYLLSTAILASVCLDTFAQETLQTVTSRGNTTNMSLQIGGASVNANTTKLFINNPSGKNWALSSGANNLSEQGFYIYNWSDNPSTPLFSLDNAGHVGIGTFSPAQNFVVSNDGAEGLEVYLNQPIGVVGLQSFNRQTSTYSKMQFDASQFAFNHGNVAIGTITPDEKLTVKGKIHAEEVRVDLGVPGPDYVFNADYPLTPLSEIQTFIKENKHLPEVPSAKEMEEKGINLSEMNILLLKKVEELTLHLIEQDKINQAQNDMLLELKKSNALLMEQFKQVNNK